MANNNFDWSEFEQFVTEFRDESDRAAVILGAAKLDLVMYQILRGFLVPTTASTDELLDGDSPLGTFSAKINVLFRFGLIDSTFVRALHLVRRIRNAFAHEVKGCSLNSGAHSDRVKELSNPFRHLPFFQEFKESFFPDATSPAVDFRVCLALMVGRLESILVNVEQISQENTWHMIPTAWRTASSSNEVTESKNQP